MIKEGLLGFNRYGMVKFGFNVQVTGKTMADTDERIARDFFARDTDEQNDLLKNTWCNNCQEVDLGMVNPVEYEFLERIFIDGECAKCGEITTTEVVYDDDDDE